MAERHVIGSDLAPNKELNGSGSTAVAGWINSAAEKWALVSVGAVTPTVAEFTEWQGRRSLHLNIASASAGAVVAVSQIPEYSAATITSASLPYLIKMKPGHSYTVSCDVYVPTGAVNCSPSLLPRQYTNILTRTGSVAALTNSTRDSWVTLTTTFTALANETYYAFLIGLTQDSASTFSGEMYISNISMVDNTETARTTATSRTTATNRVAVRDMGTALLCSASRIEANAINLSIGQPCSVAMWIKPNKLGQYAVLFANVKDASNKLYIGIRDTSNKIEGSWHNGASYFSGFRTNTLTGLSPVFFVLVYNGSTSFPYINGVYNSSGSSNIGTGGVVGKLSIGSLDGALGSPFNGIIDEPRIWNRALTPTEIQNLYLYNIVPQDGLVAEYLFDEATGTTAIDSSGNGNNGTITGATYTLDTPLQERGEV